MESEVFKLCTKVGSVDDSLQDSAGKSHTRELHGKHYVLHTMCVLRVWCMELAGITKAWYVGLPVLPDIEAMWN